MTKKYIFQMITEVHQEITVDAENYKEAEQKLEDGKYDMAEENESYLVSCECIKMPENIDEETKQEDLNPDKYQSIQSDNQDYFLQEEEQ